MRPLSWAAGRSVNIHTNRDAVVGHATEKKDMAVGRPSSLDSLLHEATRKSQCVTRARTHNRMVSFTNPERLAT